MAPVIHVNGRYVGRDDASVSVFDHGLLYGDGVFEGIRAYAGRVFKLDDHMRRLFDSASAIRLEIPLSPADDDRALVLETCRRNHIIDGYIRLVVTRGTGDLGLDPRKCQSGPTLDRHRRARRHVVAERERPRRHGSSPSRSAGRARTPSARRSSR